MTGHTFDLSIVTLNVHDITLPLTVTVTGDSLLYKYEINPCLQTITRVFNPFMWSVCFQ